MAWGGGLGVAGCVELGLGPCPVSGSLSTLGQGWSSQEQPELGDVLPLGAEFLVVWAFAGYFE